MAQAQSSSNFRKLLTAVATGISVVALLLMIQQSQTAISVPQLKKLRGSESKPNGSIGLRQLRVVRLPQNDQNSSRRLPRLNGFGGEPAASHFPLQQCEGDCDNDDECDVGLVCFQRNGGEAVPGCTGKTDNTIKTDFCILDVSNAQTNPPNNNNNNNGNNRDPPIVGTLALIGTNGSPSSAYPLGVCQGDCDSDADCAGALVCLQRDEGDSVPGCQGTQGLASRTDFCVLPPNAATESPTFAPTYNPTGDWTWGPTFSPTWGGTWAPNFTPTFSPTETPTARTTKNAAAQPSLPPPTTRPATSPPVTLPPTTSRPATPPPTTSRPATTPPVSVPAQNAPTSAPIKTLLPTSSTTSRPATTPPVSVPAQNAPTSAPIKTLLPTSSDLGPQMLLPLLQQVGNNNNFDVFPLQNCMGDCDTNRDCAQGLVCFQRIGTQPVPGCRGNGDFSVDYCIVAPPTSAPGQQSGTSDTFAPSAQQSFSSSEGGTFDGSSTLQPTMAFSSPLSSTQVPTLRAGGKVTTTAPTETVTMTPTRIVTDSLVPTVLSSNAGSNTGSPTSASTGASSFGQTTEGIPTTVTPSSPRLPFTEQPSMVNSMADSVADSMADSMFDSSMGSATNTMFESTMESSTVQPTLVGSIFSSSTMGPTEAEPEGEDETEGLVLSRAQEYIQVPQNRKAIAFPGLEKDVSSPAQERNNHLQLLGADGIFDKYPLDLCEGSCFDDDDCMEGLVCFQRGWDEPVPGCQGDGHFSANYCIVNPVAAASEIEPFVTEEVDNRTSDLPTLQSFGTDEIYDAYPFAVCQGSCFDDYDCQAGLTCFHRDGDEPVPGCSGTAELGAYYCVVDLDWDNSTQAPTGNLTWSSTGEASSIAPSALDTIASSMTVTNYSSDDDLGVLDFAFAYPAENETASLQRLQIIGNDGIYDFYPLTVCLGDCDVDEDCAEGLKCYHRRGFEVVPGCGTSSPGEYGADYCAEEQYFTDEYYNMTGNATDIDEYLDADAEHEALLEEQEWEELIEEDAMSDSDQENVVSEAMEPQGGSDQEENFVWDDQVSEALEAATNPSNVPSMAPTSQASDAPSASPTKSPTQKPSRAPSSLPSSGPTSSADYAVISDTSSRVSSGVEFGDAVEFGDTLLSDENYDDLPTLTLEFDPVYPLPECAGDCNSHDDCAEGLFCYHRNHDELPVPGCAGRAPSSADYCIRIIYWESWHNWETPVESAVDESVGFGDEDIYTDAEAEAQAEDAAWEDAGEDLTSAPNDSPTEATTTISPSELTAVPTVDMTAFESSSVSYTANPTEQMSTAAPTDTSTVLAAETVAPSGAQTGPSSTEGSNSYWDSPGDFVSFSEEEVVTPAATFAPPSMPYLQFLGNDGVFDTFPLEECQGDCDQNSDCLGEDLICMQRIADEEVPGCQGKTQFSVDYCVRAELLAQVGVSFGRKGGN